MKKINILIIINLTILFGYIIFNIKPKEDFKYIVINILIICTPLVLMLLKKYNKIKF